MWQPSERVLKWLIKPAVFVACLLPFGLLLQAALDNDLGANPIEAITHTTGDWALRLLLVTLAMTPLRRLLGQPWPIRLRRMLGLYAFFYASLHLLAWAWLDQQWLLAEIVADIAKRPYITVGFAAWLLLLPLAVTSNRFSMRRLGRRWASLHKLVYLIGLLAVLHFVWLIKADLLEPLLYAAVFAGLMLTRADLLRQKFAKYVVN